MKILKLLKKFISFEPLIIWLRYFLTVKLHNIITNFVLPIGFDVVLISVYKESLELIQFDVFSISSILVGFCSSILIMLFTIDGPNVNRLKETPLSNNDKVSIHQALIYKFSFIVINLLVLILVGIIAVFLDFTNNAYYKIYLVIILLNTIFTLIEALTNVTFCLIVKKKDEK